MNCIFPRNYPSVTCRISLLDSTEKVVEVDGNQKVWVLLHNLLDEMKLIAKEYFGLKFMDKYKQSHWMNLNRSVYPQLKNAYIERRRVCFDSNTFDVKLGLKYYPRDPCSIPEEMTRYQIFLQIRQDIIDGQLQIEKYILANLAGFILQSDCGDCSQKLNDNYVKECLPVPGLNQQLENMMKEEHKKLQGTTPDRAEFLLLDKVKWLDNYGMIKFPVKDESDNYSFLGLTPTGVIIERPNRKLVNYYWPRISSFSAYRQTLSIKVRDNRKGSTLKFQTGTKEMCRELWKLCSEHLAFYKSTQDSLTMSHSIPPPKRVSSNLSNKTHPESSAYSGYASGSDFDRATPPSTVVSDFPIKTPHNYLRQYISDVESEPTRRMHSGGLPSRTVNSQPGSAYSSSTALGTDVIYNPDGQPNAVFSEPNNMAYSNHNLKRSKKKRNRSNSPNKSRLPNEILEHIKFEQVEPNELAPNDPRDIPYTKVETKEQPLKIRYSPSMKSKGRSHFKSRPPPAEILPQSSAPVEQDFLNSNYPSHPYHVKADPGAPMVKPPRSTRSAHSDWLPYRPINNTPGAMRSATLQPNFDPGFMSDSGVVNAQYRDDRQRRGPSMAQHPLMYQQPMIRDLAHYHRQSRPLPNPHSVSHVTAPCMTSSPKSNVSFQGAVQTYQILPQYQQTRYPLSAPQQMDYRC